MPCRVASINYFVLRKVFWLFDVVMKPQAGRGRFVRFYSSLCSCASGGACLHVFLLFMLYRWLNGLLVWTYFDPDEYWQSLEIAHKQVFGYGYTTWEWQPASMLRGFFHPLVFAVLYKILQLLRLDTPYALVQVNPVRGIATHGFPSDLHAKAIARNPSSFG